ncbi:phosphopantetheine-binding protein [Cohnella boryungensis]|uniref:Acyl carrier protein n=1 Tax=Cohnella boryungensis TaxID=768479 RepID=A0ABV8S9X7_9BACL
MERQEMAERIRRIIADNLDVAVPDVLKEEDRLSEDLNLDSIMVLQLAVYLEESFGVSIPEEEVDPSVFSTVSSLIDFIGTLQEVGAVNG